MSWIVTQLCSDVASRPKRGRRASLRGQTTVGWRGLGPRDQEKRTRHAPLRGYVRVLVRTLLYSSSSSQSQHGTQNTKTGGSSALATSLRRQTRGSQPWLGRLGPTRRAAHPARLSAARIHNNSAWSCAFARISTHTIHLIFSALGILFRFAEFTSENAVGSRSEAQKSNRIGDGLIKPRFCTSTVSGFSSRCTHETVVSLVSDVSVQRIP